MRASFFFRPRPEIYLMFYVKFVVYSTYIVVAPDKNVMACSQLIPYKSQFHALVAETKVQIISILLFYIFLY